MPGALCAGGSYIQYCMCVPGLPYDCYFSRESYCTVLGAPFRGEHEIRVLVGYSYPHLAGPTQVPLYSYEYPALHHYPDAGRVTCKNRRLVESMSGTGSARTPATFLSSRL